MSTDDEPEETPEERDVNRDVGEEVRDRGREGFFSRTRQRIRDSRYIPPYDDLENADSTRRAVLQGAGVLALGGGAVWTALEATDGDGWDVDFNRDGIAGGGIVPPPAEEGTPTPGAAPGADCRSDELYIQEDGTVIALDHGDTEWYRFSPENFTENDGYAGLFDELSQRRPPQELAPEEVGPGIQVTHNELFSYDREAYNDMSDEAEWDRIFDQNPSYCSGG